ncbi:hypothetical protein OsI_06031 [Oryza sativa Indica Group]|uniref:Uncharacterized protein n=1 Tax=Oryza sativa subsp. indica TaxID=39946 RepID=B8AIJ1_ORYSI|nr:hypothetical protein OsI_06031 [Oryza sativa Indica Group]
MAANYRLKLVVRWLLPRCAMIVAKPSKGCASGPPTATPAAPTRATPAATAQPSDVDAQAFEDADHLFRDYLFTRLVWTRVVEMRAPDLQPPPNNLATWVQHLQAVGDKTTKKRNLSLLLTSWWHIWLQKNARIFNSTTLNPYQVANLIVEDMDFREFAFKPP